jgi:hypothetical protein
MHFSPTARKWCELHVAIAWVLSRDEEFCAEIADDVSASQRTFCASARLERAMMDAGCFDVVKETVPIDRPSEMIVLPKLKRGYAGRFRSLAEDYERGGNSSFTPWIEALPHAPEAAAGIVNVSDFLLGRWHEASRDVLACIADERIKARGVAIDQKRRLPAGELPAASVTGAVWMDLTGTLREGPQNPFGDQPRYWVEITVEWEGVLRCFPPGESKTSPETQCKIWLEDERRKSLHRQPKRYAELLIEAQRLFPGLSGRAFASAWRAAKEAVPESTWRAGRPRKNPDANPQRSRAIHTRP